MYLIATSKIFIRSSDTVPVIMYIAGAMDMSIQLHEMLIYLWFLNAIYQIYIHNRIL